MNNPTSKSQYNFNDKKSPEARNVNFKLVVLCLAALGVVSTGIYFTFFKDDNSKKIAVQEKTIKQANEVAAKTSTSDKNINANVNANSNANLAKTSTPVATPVATQAAAPAPDSNIIDKKIAENKQEKVTEKNDAKTENKDNSQQEKNLKKYSNITPQKISYTLYPSNYETITFIGVRIEKPVIIVNTEDKKIIHMPIERILKINKHNHYPENDIVDEDVTSKYTMF